MVTLYDYWRSTASYRVRIALGLAGLTWQSVPINLVENEQAHPDHLDRNPQGLVPVLDIDGRKLTQSLAIIEYLNETRNMGLLPEMPTDRARVRAMAHAIAMDIHPVCNLRVVRYATDHSNGAIAASDWMQDHIGSGLTAFEAMLSEGDFCHGNKISLADICLIPQLYNAHRWGISLDPMPRIRRIEAALSPMPAFKSAHPDLAPR